MVSAKVASVAYGAEMVLIFGELLEFCEHSDENSRRNVDEDVLEATESWGKK